MSKEKTLEERVKELEALYIKIANQLEVALTEIKILKEGGNI